MSFIANLLTSTGILERRRDGRVSTFGLVALYGRNANQNKARIKNLSMTGVYVVTKERWLPGTDILLTLQKRHLLHTRSLPGVRMWARSVHLGKDGVGLTFVRESCDSDAWLNATRKAAAMTGQGGVISLFRLANAHMFLFRVSPSADDLVLQSLAESLSHERYDRIIEICLRAAELLDEWSCPIRNDVPPDLIQQLLAGGSKAEDKNLQEFWAGLLATSCLDRSDDNESLDLASILSLLLPIQLVILDAGCTRVIEAGWKPRLGSSGHLQCSPTEIRKITGTRDLVAIERHLNQLHALGLLGKSPKPLNFEQLERANITPTSLGLRLFTRCSRPPAQAQTSGIARLGAAG